jgi:hypothetical protein
MITQFQGLTDEERALLLKAPVLVSVLASSSLNEVNEKQKRDAIKLAHLKTFTADPLLLPYYQEVEKQFAEQFDATAAKYFPFDEANRSRLKEEIGRVNDVIGKLDEFYGQRLSKSLQGYAHHVKRATHSVFQDFIFPLPMEGLND